LFLIQAVDEETQEVQLQVADSTQGKYIFKQATLPIKILREHSYTILEAVDNHVFLHVSHELNLSD
jgi:hypothetical protein